MNGVKEFSTPFPQKEAKANLINRLKDNPDLLLPFDSTPAFWDRGTEPGVVDVSLGYLIKAKYGIGEPIKTSKQFSKEFNISSYVIRDFSPYALEWVRGILFPEDPPVAPKKKNPPVEVIKNRVAAFYQMHELFNQPRSEDRSETFQTILQLPFYNPYNLPDSVKSLVHQCLSNQAFDQGFLPTINDFLTKCFGINTPRQKMSKIAESIGYNPVSLYRHLEGIYSVLNRYCLTEFPVSPEDSVSRSANLLEVKLKLKNKLDSANSLPLEIHDESPVNDHAARLLLMGIAPQDIPGLLNQYMLSTSLHHAPLISTLFVQEVDAKLRGVFDTAAIYSRDVDRREQAAVLLSKFENNEIINHRSQLILQVLKLLNEGYQTHKIQDMFGVKRSTNIVSLALQARLELASYPEFKDKLYKLAYEIDPTVDLSTRSYSKNIVAINESLFPLYQEFRESLSDSEKQGRLSTFEKEILTFTAQGLTQSQISKNVGIGKFSVHINQRAFLYSNYGKVWDREAEISDFRHLHSTLLEVLSNPLLIKKHYPNPEKLQLHLQILKDRIAYTRKIIVGLNKYTESELTEAMIKIRSIVDNMRTNSPTIRKH